MKFPQQYRVPNAKWVNVPPRTVAIPFCKSFKPVGGELTLAFTDIVSTVAENPIFFRSSPSYFLIDTIPF